MAEWVQDCYHENYTDAPTDGNAWEETDCTERVRRGGDWKYGDYDNLMTTYRVSELATDQRSYIGFRCARGVTR